MAGRPSIAQSLTVWLNGERVGVWEIPRNAEPSFTYAESWFDSPAFRPVSLSLPALRVNPTVKGEQVNAYFDNLLPDSDVIRRRLQAKFKTQDTGAIALLAAVGRDCVGAVQVLPAGEQPSGINSIDAVPLDNAGVEHMLRQATTSPNAMAPGEHEDDLCLAQAATHWLRLPQEDFCQATATPASAKHENEGGPGMVSITRLLAGSQHAAADIATFLKAQFMLLLLRATDGHAPPHAGAQAGKAAGEMTPVRRQPRAVDFLINSIALQVSRWLQVCSRQTP